MSASTSQRVNMHGSCGIGLRPSVWKSLPTGPTRCVGQRLPKFTRRPETCAQSNFCWDIPRWIALSGIWVWNSKMLWQLQKLLKYKRLGRSTRTALSCRSSVDLMLRRSFARPAIRASCSMFLGQVTATRTLLPIICDPQMSGFHLAVVRSHRKVIAY